MKLKTNQRVRVLATGDKRLVGKVGTVKSIREGYDKKSYASVAFEMGKTFDVLVSDLRAASVSFKKGARVRIVNWHADSNGKMGTVSFSYTKHGEPKCWVAIDGRRGGETGVPRVNLELIAKGRKGKLPPDPEGKNADRREWAQAAIDGFMGAHGVDRGDALPDLLCDLAHLCDETGEDFEGCLRRGAMHYRDETGGKGKQCFFLAIPIPAI